MTIKTSDWNSKPEPSFHLKLEPSDWSNSKPEPSFHLKLEPSNDLFTALSDAPTKTPEPNYSSPSPAVVASNVTATELPFSDQTKRSGCKVSGQVNRRILVIISGVFIACSVAFGLLERGEQQCLMRQAIDTSMYMVNPKVAVDGNNMVLVARDDSIELYPTRIAFYTEHNDEWILNEYFWLKYYYDYNVALSGDTTLVSFDDATEAFVYEYNSGSWVKKEDTIRPGLSPQNNQIEAPRVDIDGDLACICVGSCHVYRREDNVWVSTADFLETTGGKCSIVENSIVIYSNDDGLKMYRYETNSNDVVPIQDYFIPAYYGFAVSESNFVYANIDGGVSILERSNDSEPYAFAHKLNDLEHTGSFALEDNLLVIGQYDRTTIYSKEDGVWKEKAEINSMYHGHQLSDGVLLAINDHAVVEAYNLDDCMPVSDNEMSPTSPP